MRTYTIDIDGNISVYTSRKTAAAAKTGPVFANPDELTLVAGKRLVEIWNGLTGVTPVRKFNSTAVASKRIMAELEKLGAPTAAAEPEPSNQPGSAIDDSHEVIALTDGPVHASPAPATKEAKGAKQAAPAANAAKKTKGAEAAASTANGTGPRDGSKAARAIELLGRKNGVTLSELMHEFNWLSHTTRALMSAGGALTKKHGVVVISTKGADGDRVYTLAK